MKKADELKINVIAYWRFNRGCPIVAIEYNWRHSDVQAVTRAGMVIETEVKTTLHDLKRDMKKPKHHAMANRLEWVPAHYFYFAVPTQLEVKAMEIIKETYPYAGLLVVKDNNYYSWDAYHHIKPAVSAVRKAHLFTKPKLTHDETMDLVAGLSATTCKIAFELMARERRGLDGPSKDKGQVG